MADVVQGHAASVLQIRPATSVAGRLRLPGDKSISHRYVMLGAIARGMTRVTNVAPGQDVRATMACMRALGTAIEFRDDGFRTILIEGCGAAGLATPADSLDVQNSGTTLRLLSGLLAGRPVRATLTGDASLRRRPMGRVIEPLRAMGATILADGNTAPLTIHGASLRGIDWRTAVPSAQVKSALMLAGLSATGVTTVTEPQPTRDHSELAFPAFGLECAVDGTTITVRGGQSAVAPGATLEVPGDPSSAAVWAAAAAALPGSAITLEGVGLNPRRLGFVGALRSLGADVETDLTHYSGGEPVGNLTVRYGGRGACILGSAEVPDLIDELPVLAACAALGGSLEVSGAAELRVKESDRITALVNGLRALGVEAAERTDGFVVKGSRHPTGGDAEAAGDHRLVMAFAIVGLGARQGAAIRGAEAVSVSYPDFTGDLARIRQ
jgi:3-phosphoshikimate 1-carboxyvinyltransferase